MNGLALFQIALSILGGIMAQATKNKLPQDVIAAIQAAISELNKVQGSPVTKQQLETLRVDPQW